MGKGFTLIGGVGVKLGIGKVLDQISFWPVNGVTCYVGNQQSYYSSSCGAMNVCTTFYAKSLKSWWEISLENKIGGGVGGSPKSGRIHPLGAMNYKMWWQSTCDLWRCFNPNQSGSKLSHLTSANERQPSSSGLRSTSCTQTLDRWWVIFSPAVFQGKHYCQWLWANQQVFGLRLPFPTWTLTCPLRSAFIMQPMPSNDEHVDLMWHSSGLGPNKYLRTYYT